MVATLAVNLLCPFRSLHTIDPIPDARGTCRTLQHLSVDPEVAEVAGLFQVQTQGIQAAALASGSRHQTTRTGSRSRARLAGRRSYCCLDLARGPAYRVAPSSRKYRARTEVGEEEEESESSVVQSFRPDP